MIMDYSSRKSKIQCLTILGFYIRSIKALIYKTEILIFRKVCSFMHSVFGQGSYCVNYSILATTSYAKHSIQKGVWY